MDTTTIIFEVFAVASAIVGVYMKLTTEIGKLKGRVIALEKSEGEVKELLNELLRAVQEVKILLAGQGIK